MGEKWNILDYEIFNNRVIIAYWDNGEVQRFTRHEILEIARMGKKLYPNAPEFRGPGINYGWNMKRYSSDSVYGRILKKYSTDPGVMSEMAKAIISGPVPKVAGNGERFSPVKVIFHDPATIVYWADGTKTVVNCQEGDTYSKETGLALCFMKKACGNNARFNNMMRNCIYDAYLHQGGESHEDD